MLWAPKYWVSGRMYYFRLSSVSVNMRALIVKASAFKVSIYSSTEMAIKILGGCQNRESINIYIENIFPISMSYFTSAMSICKTELL